MVQFKNRGLNNNTAKNVTRIEQGGVVVVDLVLFVGGNIFHNFNSNRNEVYLSFEKFFSKSR